MAEGVISPVIESSVTNYITEYLDEKVDELTPDNVEEELPTVLKMAAGIFNIDVKEIVEEGSRDVVEVIVEKLAGPVVNIISTVLAFIALYLLSKLLLTFVIFLINSLFDNGLFGALNKILGFIFSTIIAVAAAWALAVIIAFVFNLPAIASSEMIQEFTGGFFYNFFNTYNPVELLLSF